MSKTKNFKKTKRQKDAKTNLYYNPTENNTQGRKEKKKKKFFNKKNKSENNRLNLSRS